MKLLRQSTAKVISFGPFVDATDGKTWETGLVSALDHATTGIKISKNGAALAVRNATVTATTYDAYGNYLVTLDTTDTATLGLLRVQWGDETTSLAVWDDFAVVPANVYDAMVLGTDVMNADVTQWLGTACATPTVAGVPEVDLTRIAGAAVSTTAAQLGVNIVQISEDATAADNAEAVFDNTGYAMSNSTVGTVTTLTGHTAQTGDNYARIGAGGVGLTALMSAAEGTSLRDIVESQRGEHTVHGQVFYVDPVNGDDDVGDGSRDAPYLTVQAAHNNLVTDSAHDCIILMAGEAAAVTTMYEAVTLTKRFLQIRGPGRDFIWTNPTAGTTITLSGDGIGISGVRIQTDATGNGHGVAVTSGADFCGIRKCWFENTRGSGVHITDASNTIIEDCVFEEVGQSGAGRGINLAVSAGSVHHTFIRRCHISNAPNSGIRLGGAGVEDTLIQDCSIHGSGGYGIAIIAGTVDTMICGLCAGDNASGDVSDAGTTTVQAFEHLIDRMDTALTASHGSGSWSSSGLAGARAVTLHAQTGAGAAIPGAVLSIRDSTDTTTLSVVSTDSAGDVDINIDDGTYVVRGVLAGYVIAAQTIAVSADGTINITGTAVTTSTPSAPDGCVLYGTIVREDGAALQGD
jgi:hypothetical protein